VAAALVVVALAAALALAPSHTVHAQENPAPSDAQAVPGPSHAQVPPGEPIRSTPAIAPAQAIEEILKRPEFDEYRERTMLEYLGKQDKREEKPKPRRDWSSWATVIEALAQILRILAWAAVGVALVFIAYFVLRNLGLLSGGAHTEYVPPQTLFGLDVRPESLPENLAAEAARLARAGELAKALSLLYRGALTTLLHRDGVELAGGDTEEDCLRKSRPRLESPTHAYFTRLLLAWQQLAYARRRVPLDEIEALCTDWPSHFEGSKG
jgi:hypothetical protein